MKNLDLKKVLTLLGFILRCPVCGYRYNLESMKIVEGDQNDLASEGRIVLHSDCQKCQGSVMFSIGVMGPEMISSASVTDLTLADSHHFRDAEPLSANDVLDIRAALGTFKGDFKKVLQGEKAVSSNQSSTLRDEHRSDSNEKSVTSEV
jgi:hypothetical protein